jgi:PBP1b-binding outer membrane lipoprotein LpoB
MKNTLIILFLSALLGSCGYTSDSEVNETTEETTESVDTLDTMTLETDSTEFPAVVDSIELDSLER